MATIKLSKSQWEFIGAKTGWLKTEANKTEKRYCPSCKGFVPCKKEDKGYRCGKCGAKITVKVEFQDDECLKTEEAKKKKGKKVNPWAVCNKSVGKKKNPEKFERCVMDVKKKHPIKKD